MHVVTHLCRLFQHLHFLEHLLPAFRPADGFLPVEGAQLFDDGLLMLNFLLLVQPGAHLGRADLFLFHRIVGIASGKNACPSAVQFYDLRGDPVQEIPVVGDDEHRALVVRKPGFQPGDGVHVQMVGGLVQNDQVRTRQEKTAQGDAGLLAAGEGGNLFGKFFLRKAESFQHAGHFAAAAVAVHLLKAVGEPGVFFHQGIQVCAGDLLHLKLAGADFLFQKEHLLFRLKHLVVDGLIAFHLRVLRQIAEAYVLSPDNDPFVRLQLPGEDAKQRGLSRSVDADDGGFFVIFYMKRAVFENLLFVECLTHVLAG